MRISRSARRHRIGNAHILFVIATSDWDVDDDARRYVGEDDRGVELEVVIVPDDKNQMGWTAIHAMPTALRPTPTEGKEER